MMKIFPHPTNSAYNAGIYHCAQLEGADTPLPLTNSAYNAGIYRCAQLESAVDKEFRFPFRYHALQQNHVMLDNWQQEVMQMN